MTDITTVETVRCGDYEVRVGRGEGGYHAVVAGQKGGRQTTSPMFALMSKTRNPAGGSDAEALASAPAVSAPHRWVAVGLAVEAYEWAETAGATVDIDAGESLADADVDAEALADELASEFGGGGE